MDFSTIKKWAIPEGYVYQVRDADGNLLWQWKPYWNITETLKVSNTAGTSDVKINVESPEVEEWEILTPASWLRFSHVDVQPTGNRSLTHNGQLNNISIEFDDNPNNTTRNTIVSLRYYGTTTSLGSFIVQQEAGTGTESGDSGGSTGGSTEEPSQLTVSPVDITFPASGGSNEISVTTNEKWSYQVQYQGDDDPGLQVEVYSGNLTDNYTNVQGNGILSVTPNSHNDSDKNRYWYVTIITQSGNTFICTITQHYED